MARLECIELGSDPNAHRADSIGHVTNARIFELPQIFDGDGNPWREANLWLYERAIHSLVAKDTLTSNASCLRAYASWLDDAGLHWQHFPLMKKDRCLVRYRNHLIVARRENRLASSTASLRMRTVVNFYRWAKTQGLLTSESPLWQSRRRQVRVTDQFGVERSLSIISTDLAIRHRRKIGSNLEGGVFPVSAKERDLILAFARHNAPEELFLMLSLGFFTGLRLGSITDLRTATLENAVPCDPGVSLLSVGPAASPPVSTKFGVTGQVWIANNLLGALQEYSFSERRLTRTASACSKYSDLVFLTKAGNSYASRGVQRSPAVNVAMHGLRKLARANSIDCLNNFNFHQTRATFATELARLALSTSGPQNAVAFVKDALLHQSEQTSFKYIKFVEDAALKSQVSDEFTRAFMGILSGDNRG